MVEQEHRQQAGRGSVGSFILPPRYLHGSYHATGVKGIRISSDLRLACCLPIPAFCRFIAWR